MPANITAPSGTHTTADFPIYPLLRDSRCYDPGPVYCIEVDAVFVLFDGEEVAVAWNWPLEAANGTRPVHPYSKNLPNNVESDIWETLEQMDASGGDPFFVNG